MLKKDPIWPEIGIFPGLEGSFGALLVGWLVVVARGLYLARHLFTLSFIWVVAILVVICAHKEIKGMQRRDIAQKMRHGG